MNSEKLEVPLQVINDTLEQLEQGCRNPTRTQESKDILVAVIRTLHWIKTGANGELVNLNAMLCSEQIVAGDSDGDVEMVDPFEAFRDRFNYDPSWADFPRWLDGYRNSTNNRFLPPED